MERKRGKVQRTVFLCFVFGATGSGKVGKDGLFVFFFGVFFGFFFFFSCIMFILFLSGPFLS